jgi:hypothetical protein
MIFCARATRGRGLSSLDARNRRSSAPIPEGNTSELGGIYWMDVIRSMRAVKGSLGHSLEKWRAGEPGGGQAPFARRALRVVPTNGA